MTDQLDPESVCAPCRERDHDACIEDTEVRVAFDAGAERHVVEAGCRCSWWNHLDWSDDVDGAPVNQYALDE